MGFGFVSAAWWNPLDWFDEPGLSPDTCVDTDGGQNYDVYGWTNYTFGDSTQGWWQDRCKSTTGPNQKILLEAFCVENTMDYVEYECPIGCADGVCTPYECDVDDDCPDNPLAIYKECGTYNNCLYSVADNCTDSDDGFNAYNQGTALIEHHTTRLRSYFGGGLEDVCSSTSMLKEYYCSQDPYSFHDKKKHQNVYCPNGCSDGACQGSPTTTCEKGWKCVEDDSVYINSSCIKTDKEHCFLGCAYDKCIEDSPDFYDLGVTNIYYNPRKYSFLVGDSFKINITFVNNLNKKIENIKLILDDSKGWNVEKVVNFSKGETKNVSFDFLANNLHSKYNKHEFSLKSDQDILMPNPRFNKYTIFDNNTITNLTEEEGNKTVMLDEKKYNVFLRYLNRYGDNLDIEDDITTENFSEDQASYVILYIREHRYVGDVGYITFAIAPPGKNATCEDTDNGKIYGDRGETCFGADCRYDSCNRYNLTEYYCENDEIKSEIHECEDLCEAGMCLTQCATCGAGDRGCIDEDTYEICVDDGGCSFYEQFDCEAGQICEDGECTTPLPDNACDTTGLRENRKYCSSELVWINQKQTNNLCDEDFECRSNNCEIRCQGSSPPPTPTEIYWIIGILVAVLIIGIIVSLILAKKK